MSEADTADERAVAKATKNLERASGAVETAEAAVAAAVEAHAEAQRAVLAAQTQQEQVLSAAAAVGDGTDGSIFDEPDTGDLDEADFGVEVKARREYHPHESPWLMTLPLVVLAAGAVVAGVMNLPFSKDLHFLGNWLEPSLYNNEEHLSSGAGAKWALAIVAVIGGAVGIAAAVTVYLQRRIPASRVELPLFARGWFVDESITNFMGGPGRKSFDAVVRFDTTVVDGTVNRVGRWVRLAGNAVRRVQSGFVRSYALMVAIGAVALFAWFLSRASW
ncbi:MAG: hypothetical protein OXH78_00610 [Acidimicrobiaceae bacterium]|nr:hypothetical protein [Acidimicrobiaceae bacterium]